MTEGFSFSGIALDPIWYAELSLQSLLSPVVFLIIIASIAVIYPAAKAALISPVDAIHHH